MKNSQKKKDNSGPVAEPPITDPRLYCCVCQHFFDDKKECVDAGKKPSWEGGLLKKKHKELEVCVINLQRDIYELRR